MVERAVELVENVTAGLEKNITSELGENATTASVWMGPAAEAVEGNPHRGPRRAEQHDRRCALPSFIRSNTNSGETADTVLELTQTVDRYLVKPAAHYENRMWHHTIYREKPAVANVLIRRKRPVPVQRIGLFSYYVQRVDFADRGR